MKFLVFLILGLLYSFNLIFSAGLPTLNVDDYNVYTKQEDKVINESNLGEDPLRQGATDLATNTEGIVNTPVENSIDAQNETLKFIKKIVDYILGLLAFLILLYIIYGGFLMLSAGGNEDKYKNGFDKVKIGIIVVIGIGLSWLIVSFLFYLVNKFIV